MPLAVIGLAERHGLKQQAQAFIARRQTRSVARFLTLYLAVRESTAALGLTSLGLAACTPSLPRGGSSRVIDALYGGKTSQFIETQVKFEDGRTGSVSATLRIDDAKTFTPVKAAA